MIKKQSQMYSNNSNNNKKFNIKKINKKENFFNIH